MNRLLRPPVSRVEVVNQAAAAQPVGEVLVLAVRPVADDGPGSEPPDRGMPVRALVAAPAGWAAEAARLGVDPVRRLQRRGATGRAGEVVAADLDDDEVEALLLVGIGDRSPAAWRAFGAAVGAAVRGRVAVTVVLPPRVGAEVIDAVVTGLQLAGHRYPGRRAPAGLVRLVARGATGRAVQAAAEATARARATLLARELAATPSSTKDPRWLAAAADRFGRAAGLDVRVRDEKDLLAEGFGGLLAVGGGSSRPPRLVAMTYLPGDVGAAAAKALPHVVLVGKGITFDTGGLSLKPREAMVPMKTDMAGAAAVLAVMTALPELGVAARVTGVLACAENMPGASAYRPGDVITHWGGRTSEVVNTDAEGRLVLADALAWAAATLRPDVIIDVATLTGAATLGLGRTHAALLTTSDRLAGELGRAGEAVGEALWRLPLHEDYRAALDSTVADARHAVMARQPGGGAITAGLFLEPFAAGVPWAHLDIAGTGRSERESDLLPKGATGYGAALLLRWLAARSCGPARAGSATPRGRRRPDAPRRAGRRPR